MKGVYMAVTPDKYELPVKITETAKQMGDWLGVSENSIYISVCSELSGKRNGFKIVRVKF
ncbi:hypothetical protein [Clostridium sardiniense]|uniref:hypothetical protein n=1 Tax=Clostridium sardiniense TaxID=29369 RepID=UPI001957B8EB|nr:hypothetical protein [Clostridium sardiniense]MBM7836463.1 hypothetical protein [Clostridium sardiniense]